jgi:hypothetical protein
VKREVARLPVSDPAQSTGNDPNPKGKRHKRIEQISFVSFVPSCLRMVFPIVIALFSVN